MATGIDGFVWPWTDHIPIFSCGGEHGCKLSISTLSYFFLAKGVFYFQIVPHMFQIPVILQVTIVLDQEVPHQISVLRSNDFELSFLFGHDGR